MSSVVAVDEFKPKTCHGLKFSRTSIPLMQVGPFWSLSSSGTAIHFLYCFLQSSVDFKPIFSPAKAIANVLFFRSSVTVLHSNLLSTAFLIAVAVSAFDFACLDVLKGPRLIVSANTKRASKLGEFECISRSRISCWTSGRVNFVFLVAMSELDL